MSSESSNTSKKTILQDLTYFGMRLSIGLVFVMAGSFKLANREVLEQMVSMGLPVEFTSLVSLGELLAGIFLIVGVLSRISATVVSLIMLGIIFYIKWTSGYFGPNGWEFDLVLLSASLVFIVFGPKRISLAYLLKKVPSFLH